MGLAPRGYTWHPCARLGLNSVSRSMTLPAGPGRSSAPGPPFWSFLYPPIFSCSFEYLRHSNLLFCFPLSNLTRSTQGLHLRPPLCNTLILPCRQPSGPCAPQRMSKGQLASRAVGTPFLPFFFVERYRFIWTSTYTNCTIPLILRFTENYY